MVAHNINSLPVFLNYVEGFTITDAACLTVLTTLSIAISTTPINLGTFEIIVSGYLIKIFSVPISEAIGLAGVSFFDCVTVCNSSSHPEYHNYTFSDGIRFNFNQI